MTVEYLDLADYLAIAAAVTGLDVDHPLPDGNKRAAWLRRHLGSGRL